MTFEGSFAKNVRKGKKPIKSPASPSLADRAQALADYDKWEALALEAEGTNKEDALAVEHRAEPQTDFLYEEAYLYWLRRAIGEDAQGFSAFGEHLRKPQELAKMYGVEVNIATDKVTDAHAEVEAWCAQQIKKGGFESMKAAALREIRRREGRLE